MRKKHNTEDGYIAERRNPFIHGQKVVIYIAEKQGIDIDDKYGIICDAHGTIGSASSIPKARLLMKNPHNFCEECRDHII